MDLNIFAVDCAEISWQEAVDTEFSFCGQLLDTTLLVTPCCKHDISKKVKIARAGYYLVYCLLEKDG